MAKELKPGEPVTVKRDLHISRKSEAYQHGLKRVKPGAIGEVVGPAEGRALTVRFNGIDTIVSKLRLTRPAELPTQKEEPAAPAPDGEEGTFYLLNAEANNLPLKGSTRVEPDGVVELSQRDLPADVRARLQALIDAILAFNPK